MSAIGIVLHKPRMADNVGGVARAMANFGLSRLVLSSPATWHFDSRSAVRAEHILENAHMALSFEEAVAPFSWVCGTTSRRVRRRPALTPREMAAEAMRRLEGGGSICVVIGAENHGLTSEDLERCDAICRIETSAEQPSINLAQAASILTYELSLALRGPRPPRETARRASREDIDRLFEVAREVLLDVGFLNPQQPEKILAELRRLLIRGEPTHREAGLLTAAAQQIRRSLRL